MRGEGGGGGGGETTRLLSSIFLTTPRARLTKFGWGRGEESPYNPTRKTANTYHAFSTPGSC